MAASTGESPPSYVDSEITGEVPEYINVNLSTKVKRRVHDVVNYLVSPKNSDIIYQIENGPSLTDETDGFAPNHIQPFEGIDEVKRLVLSAHAIARYIYTREIIPVVCKCCMKCNMTCDGKFGFTDYKKVDQFMKNGGFAKYNETKCPLTVNCPNLYDGTCPNYHAEIHKALGVEIVRQLYIAHSGEIPDE